MRIFIILSCLLWFVSAVPNQCCPDNAEIEYRNCSNGKKQWPKHECPFGAYIITNDEFNMTYDDSIMLLEAGYPIIPKDKYCLGIEGNEKVAMVCFSSEESEDSGPMNYLARIICSSISVICLILTLIVYLILPNLRDLQGKCMMFTLFSLLMAFLFLAIVQNPVDENSATVCFALASLLYFWFMCVFFWLNVVSFNMWRSVVRPKLLSSKKIAFILYNAYGWGGPIIFLCALFLCHFLDGNHIKPAFGIVSCWFEDRIAVRTFFYGPVFILIILNIIMFLSTALKLYEQNKYVTNIKHRSHKFKFCLYLKLFLIMGLCWIFEPMSEVLFREGYYLWIVTDYINSLQGLIIFFLLVVFRKRVRRDLAQRCRRLPNEWATMPDEDCEELEDDVDEITIISENNEQNNQVP